MPQTTIASARRASSSANFSNEMLNLYHKRRRLFSSDDAPVRTHRKTQTLLTLTFACFSSSTLISTANLDIFHSQRDTSKPTSTPSRPKSLTPNPHICFTTIPKANSPMCFIKSAQIWQSRWLGEVEPMGDIDKRRRLGSARYDLQRTPRTFSEMMVATANAWIKIQLVGRTSNRDGIGCPRSV